MNDDIDKDISFDSNNICHHCQRFDKLIETRVFEGKEAENKLNKTISKIKNKGKGKKYDCVIGVSGGVDSTYVAFLTKKLGLRPLAVHLDNGWNSELAVQNLKNTLDKLDIDLYTHILNWDEFKKLQLAFLYASTPDGEIPSDHAIFATLWKIADRFNIKYIISGMNFRTESISIPNWAYGHSDWFYIKDVFKKYSKNKLEDYPHFTPIYLFYLTFIRRIKTISILNYVDYKKADAMRILTQELGWKYYGGKHFESIYTRFFQGYILPKKFNIDKRYIHLSDLINSNQITRGEALNLIEEPPYPEELQINDMEYVKKKLDLTDDEFETIMNKQIRNFRSFKNIYRIVNIMKNVVNFMRKKGIYPK